MTPENDPAQVGLGGPQRFDLEGEFEARPSPRQPGDLVAEAPLGQLRTVLCCGEGDHRIGVEMVDVVGVEQRVHGGVDAGRRPGRP